MSPPTAPLLSPVVPAERSVFARLLEAGRAAHPSLGLSDDRFGDALLERAGWAADDAGVERLAALLALDRRGRAGDLFLAVACDAGVNGAWDRLCELALPAVARALSSQGLPPADADAEARDLPGHLIQPPFHGRSATRLGGYRGGAALATFLTTAALARWTSERRRKVLASLDAAPAGDDGTRLTDPGALAEPALQTLVASESARRLAAALPRGWSLLTPNEGLALLYKVRDRLPQTTVAELLGVGPPRVSRILDRAYERLREALVPTVGADLDGVDGAAFVAVVGKFLATLPPGPRR